jgi:hypothetical protein
METKELIDYVFKVSTDPYKSLEIRRNSVEKIKTELSKTKTVKLPKNE